MSNPTGTVKKHKGLFTKTFNTITLLISALLISTQALAVVIASGTTRITPVVLGPVSVDGNTLIVQAGATLSINSILFTRAVFMDGNTSANNSGLIRRLDAPADVARSIFGPRVISLASGPRSITNNSGGVIQWITGAGLGAITNFDTVQDNLTIVNAGTITGKTFLLARSAVNTINNSGTINVFNGGLDVFTANGAGGTLLLTNSGIINTSGRVTVNDAINFTNTGTFDPMTPQALGLAIFPTTQIIMTADRSFVFNNTGNFGVSVVNGDSISILSNGDLQVFNSGNIGTLNSNTSFTAGNSAGAASIGSTFINTATGVILSSSGGEVVNFNNTIRPSTIVNRGLFVGNMRAGGNVGGPTTIFVGGPASVVQGNIVANSNVVNNTLNIIGDFNFNGQINQISNVNVLGGTFTLQSFGPNTTGVPALINGFNTFTIANGATANIFATVQGSDIATMVNNGILNFETQQRVAVRRGLTNNGTLNINTPLVFAGDITNNGLLNFRNDVILRSTLTNNGVFAVTNARTLTGDYTQSGTGIFQTTLTDMNNYGSLTILGNSAFSAGTTVQVLLSSNNTVTEGNFFDVIRATNALPQASAFVVDSSTVPLFTFVPTIVNGNILRLLTLLRSINFESPNFSPNDNAIAQVFNEIQSGPHDPEWDQYFGALARLSPEARAEAFSSIAPGAYQAGILAGLSIQDTWMKKVTALLDLQRQATLHLRKSGYLAGDVVDDRSSISPIFFTNNQRQQTHNLVPGYKTDTRGVGVVWDGCLTPVFRVGLGLSSGESNVKEGRHFDKKTYVASYGGLAYGSYEDGPVFIDGMLNVGFNRYHYRQHIYINQFHLVPKGNYSGAQWGGRIRAGYGIPIDCFEVQPLVTFVAARGKQYSYSQHDVGVLNQRLRSRHREKAQGGAGLRIAYMGMCDWFVPEAHALYLREFGNRKFSTTGIFLGGGPLFTVTTPHLPKDGGNVGLSLTGCLSDDWMITAGYDLEFAKKFKSHVGNLRLRWLF